MRSHRQHRWAIAVFNEVMLGNPHRVESELLRKCDLLNRLRVQPLGWHLPLRRVAKIIEQPKLHHTLDSDNDSRWERERNPPQRHRGHGGRTEAYRIGSYSFWIAA